MLITTVLLHYYNHFTCPGLPGWASTRKVKPKPIWISWSKRQWHQLGHMQICTSPKPCQHLTTHFSQAGCLLVIQPIASKHWRLLCALVICKSIHWKTSRQSWFCKSPKLINYHIASFITQRHTYTHTHNHFTALLESVRDYPGEQVPER